jgi:hypothetical protein
MVMPARMTLAPASVAVPQTIGAPCIEPRALRR